MKTYKVVLIEDHPLVREGMKHLLEQEQEFSVCGEAEDFETAISVLERIHPQMAIIDLSLKGVSGLEIVKRIKLEMPEIKSIVISMHDEKLYAERAIKAGARGYVMKHQSITTLLKAFKTVASGEIYLSDDMKKQMLEVFASGQPMEDHIAIRKLSDRELEIFQLIGRGYRSREIADLLHVSIKTIESHRENIKEKMSVKNATELQHLATQWVQTNNTSF